MYFFYRILFHFCYSYCFLLSRFSLSCHLNYLLNTHAINDVGPITDDIIGDSAFLFYFLHFRLFSCISVLVSIRGASVGNVDTPIHEQCPQRDIPPKLSLKRVISSNWLIDMICKIMYIVFICVLAQNGFTLTVVILPSNKWDACLYLFSWFYIWYSIPFYIIPFICLLQNCCRFFYLFYVHVGLLVLGPIHEMNVMK